MPPSGSPDQPEDKLLNACPACGQHLDVSEIEPFSKIECPTCEQPIRVRTQFDHFSLRTQVGEGGMSRVFQARDETLGRDVALKILNRDYSRDSERIQQFEREAKITASISHPNVVKLYSVGEDQGFFYLAMELIDNASLEQELLQHHRIPELKVLDIAIAVVDGLRTAFNSGLIHRDLKPGNILLDSAGTARIVDFGLALMVERDVDESGEIWATPFYVPPEKLYNEPEDFRSDIYSLGATLFHLLSGEPPFRADTTSIEELKKLKDAPVSLAQFAPDISQPTCEIIDRMMKRQPGDRFQSYSDLYDALKVAKGKFDGTIKTTTINHTTDLLKAGRSKSTLIGGLALGAVVLAATVIVLMVTKPWASDEGGDGPDNGDSGTTGLKTTGGKTTSELFTEARQALLDGNYSAAHAGFREIAAAKATVQPTKNRARMNAGICALLEGREADARALFEEIYSDGLYSEEPGDAGLAKFYLDASEKLIGTRPVDSSAARGLDESAEQASGLLAFGLKNWELGDLDSAVEFFTAFDKVDLPEQMAAYKSLTGRYLADRKLVDEVPETIEGMKLPYCDKSLKRLALIKENTQTQGYIQRMLAKRTAYFEKLYPALKQQYETEQAELSQQLLAKEQEDMSSLLESLSELGETYDIQKAIGTLASAKFSVNSVKEIQEDELTLWKESGEFLNLMVKDIGEFGYKGTLERRGGKAALAGEAISASRNELKFKAGAATTNVPIADIPPKALLAIAGKLIDNIDDSDAYYLRLELSVSFARQMGVESAAAEAIDELLRDKREFRPKWKRITSRSAGKSDL